MVDWIDSLDSVEGRKTFLNVLDEVDDLVRTCNSICTHIEHSKVKVKKKYKSEGSTGTGTGGMSMSLVSMTPPTVPVRAPAASTAVHLRAEEDPLGLLCSHLVCPSLSHASVTRSTG